MNVELKSYRSFEVYHGDTSTGRITIALFPDRIVVGMTTLGCTTDIHLTLAEAERLTETLVELLGKCNAEKA